MKIVIPVHKNCLTDLLKVHGTIVRLSASFTKGDNFRDFLFASLEGKALSSGDLFLKEILCRVVTNHPPKNSLIFPTFYSFSYPLTDQKIIFILYFSCANFITSNLGVTLKGKYLLPKSGLH